MRIRALAIRIVRQIVNDKRTLALMLLAPLLVLTLVKFVFDGQNAAPRIGAVGLPPAVTDALRASGAEITAYDSPAAAQSRLAAAELDAVLSVQDGKPSVMLEGASPSIAGKVLSVVQSAMRSLTPDSAANMPQPEIAYLHGDGDRTLFDYYGSVLVGFFAFFFVFLISGVSFLRERTTGTLQRLLATPLRRWEIVVGYLLGFGLFTLLQAALIAWYSTAVLGIALEGSFALALTVTLLLSLAALTLGTLLSAYAQNEFQMIQFIPLVVVPQIFFAGLIELKTMPDWLQWLGHAMPLYYGADALRGVMLRGADWADIVPDVAALLAFSLAFALLNVLALRKHRRI